MNTILTSAVVRRVSLPLRKLCSWGFIDIPDEATSGERSYFSDFVKSSVHRKVAFALAEVLITLGIIGAVAALTLPSIINDYQMKQSIASLKQHYSVITNAFHQAMSHDEVSDFTKSALGKSFSSGNVSNVQVYISKYFNNAKVVSDTEPLVDYNDSYQNSNHKLSLGTQKNSLAHVDVSKSIMYRIDLPNATYYIALEGQQDEEAFPYRCSGRDEHGNAYMSTCTNYVFPYGEQVYLYSIYIDTNGAYKRPNTIGKDLFGIRVDSTMNYVSQSLQSNHNTNSCHDPFRCFDWLIQNSWEIKHN